MPRNWEEHYERAGELDFTPAPLLVEAAGLLPPGRALDLACGAGRNALHLAGLGWSVTAVDASSSAIRILRERAAAAGLPIETHAADLEAGAFAIAPAAYDLICDFLYLQRDLFPAIREGVRPGGAFAGEILLGEDSPFRMRSGELRAEFAGWKILYYSESGRSARILARRA